MAYISYLGNGETHGFYFDEGRLSHPHVHGAAVLDPVDLHLTGEGALVEVARFVHLQDVDVLVADVVHQLSPFVATEPKVKQTHIKNYTKNGLAIQPLLQPVDA